MVSVRAAKAKGSAFEYDCQDSLKQKCPLIYRTSERGFQLQYDLRVDDENFPMVFECKRLKSMSWNQAKQYFHKLMTVKPTEHKPYLLFKSNRQPCLVMYIDDSVGILTVREFEKVFGVPFIKHASTRNKRGDI